MDKNKVAAYSKNYYDNDIREITCRCGVVFTGKRNSKTCSAECTKASKLAGMELHYHITKCKDCSIIIKKITKYGKKSKDKVLEKRCSECSKKHRKNFQKNKNADIINANKENYVEVVQKNGKTIYINKEKYNKNVERMLLNNPMYNKDTVKKVQETFKTKIKNGEILYKKGKENHLWKGNRDKNHTIRTRLLDWRKGIMVYYQWKCVMCKSNKKLEVHHTKPLRTIIEDISDIPLAEYDINSECFEKLIIKVIEYHNTNDVGILLCEECHSHVDVCRKIKKQS